MNFVEKLRSQLLDPATDDKRIADITNLLTYGYICGAKGTSSEYINDGIIASFHEEIIRNADAILEDSPLTKAELKRLEDRGVKTRLTDAKNDAIAYREYLAAEAKKRGQLARDVYTGNCSTCPQAALLGSGDCPLECPMVRN